MTITPVATARLLGGTPPDPLPRISLDEVVDLAARSGLTGRGGAGFPTERKLAAVAASRARPVVVGNAMEGEPLSRKDALLLRTSPGLVLDGLELLGGALRVKRTVLAVGHHIDPSAVQVAAAQRPVEVRRVEGGFAAGQESALVNRLAGRPGLPSDPRRPVWQHGLDGRPTLVLNAETLARLALLARYGDAVVPGTRLVSVSGSSADVLARPGVHEVAEGSTLGEVLEAAGVATMRVRAVLAGGYHGTWRTRPDDRLDVGIVHVLDRRDCPLRASADIASYLARESLGQCGPCLNGLPRMAHALDRLARREADPTLSADVERMQALVIGRGACGHPDGTARFVASTMQVFAGHVTEHQAGRCHAA
ncbi:NADH-quinone oxidoreductase subunit F [Nocardioides mangrovicus]|uniref:NADH-quinone oxidoreductase subunit F n=1 Tax=Nocardioides mangrovicus TaxID=2478913 RepID=A0A3L8P5Y7_9ACTN|nr:NADH-ubiquinone oxidoreductase-F iron-sulfur binding region domain-containing protein [Nocardioides mangrovicus]RLV50665.1 NADH-quinone oxidoreductase subunit F [Nocardioides mangrovicus]